MQVVAEQDVDVSAAKDGDLLACRLLRKKSKRPPRFKQLIMAAAASDLGQYVCRLATRDVHALATLLTALRNVVDGVFTFNEAGVYHNDIKAANVLVFETPGGLVMKLNDYDLALDVAGIALNAAFPGGLFSNHYQFYPPLAIMLANLDSKSGVRIAAEGIRELTEEAYGCEVEEAIMRKPLLTVRGINNEFATIAKRVGLATSAEARAAPERMKIEAFRLVDTYGLALLVIWVVGAVCSIRFEVTDAGLAFDTGASPPAFDRHRDAIVAFLTQASAWASFDVTGRAAITRQYDAFLAKLAARAGAATLVRLAEADPRGVATPADDAYDSATNADSDDSDSDSDDVETESFYSSSIA